MKDHSKNDEEKKTFILSYKVKDNKLIVKYANKDEVEYDYSKENEETIKKVMYEQINSLEKSHDHLTINFSVVLLGVSLLVFIASSYMWVGFTFLGLGALCGLTDLSRLISNKDIEKQKLFVDNEQLINEKLDKPNSLNSVSKKTKKVIEDNDMKMDLNKLDLVKLRDLRKILTNIERSGVFEKERPKILINDKLQ